MRKLNHNLITELFKESEELGVIKKPDDKYRISVGSLKGKIDIFNSEWFKAYSTPYGLLLTPVDLVPANKDLREYMSKKTEKSLEKGVKDFKSGKVKKINVRSL